MLAVFASIACLLRSQVVIPAGDGKTLVTAEINAAIERVYQAGGGTVRFPTGRYLTGTVYLKSRVELELDRGAVLLGSTNPADYPHNPGPYPGSGIEFGRMSLIYAEGAEDVAISGAGTIDGQGRIPAWNTSAMRASGMSDRDAYLLRPYGLCFVRCRGVRVEGVHLKDLVFWSEDYLECEDVLVRGLDVRSIGGQNNDGIDVDGSRNVRISDCNFLSGDDAICLKSSREPCDGVTVANCTLSTRCNGVKLGTASRGGFRNVTVSNCAMRSVGLAGIAIESVDGGTVANLAFDNIVMDDVGAPIFIRLGDRGTRWVDRGPRLPAGSIEGIAIDNVVARSRRAFASSIAGIPGHPVRDVLISDTVVYADLGKLGRSAAGSPPERIDSYPEFSMFGPFPACGFFVRHASDVRFRNVLVRRLPDDLRPLLSAQDVARMDSSGLTGQPEDPRNP